MKDGISQLLHSQPLNHNIDFIKLGEIMETFHD